MCSFVGETVWHLSVPNTVCRHICILGQWVVKLTPSLFIFYFLCSFLFISFLFICHSFILFFFFFLNYSFFLPSHLFYILCFLFAFSNSPTFSLYLSLPLYPPSLFVSRYPSLSIPTLSLYPYFSIRFYFSLSLPSSRNLYLNLAFFLPL